MKKYAIVVVEQGEPVELDSKALAQFRKSHKELRLYCINLNQCNTEVSSVYDRIILLPLGKEHYSLAEAIGMQICLNEGNTFVGCVSGLNSSQLHMAAQCFEPLASGTKRAVFARKNNSSPGKLFLSERASFLASFWGALSEEFLEERMPILGTILELATSNTVDLPLQPKTRGFDKLGTYNLLSLSKRQSLRKKLGVRIGLLSEPKAQPINKVAVITPYYKESDDELLRCIESVRRQSFKCDHFMISDGFPNQVAKYPNIKHIELGVSHSDNGNTPRYVGGLVAFAQGYDAIAYLDADNWYEPHHIESLVALQHKTLATAVFAMRNICLSDGFKLPDPELEDVMKLHVDTSCYLVTKECEYIAFIWGQMPKSWGPVCDRVVYSALSGQNVAWTENRTLNFKSNYAPHYQKAGRPIPENTNDVPGELWASFLRPDVNFVTNAVNRLGRFIPILFPY